MQHGEMTMNAIDQFNQEFCQSHWASSKLKSGCALVIGMHPDEATEPMVDLCLKFGRSFAVVPCCVITDVAVDIFADAIVVADTSVVVDTFSLIGSNFDEISCVHLSIIR